MLKSGKIAWKTSSGKKIINSFKKKSRNIKSRIHLNTVLKEDASTNTFVSYRIVVMRLRTSHWKHSIESIFDFKQGIILYCKMGRRIYKERIPTSLSRTRKISTLIFHFWNCFIKFQLGGWYDVPRYHKISRIF